MGGKMLEESERRKQLSIGNCIGEILEMANETGYPILLVPFGSEKCVRVKDHGELLQNIEYVLREGLWSLVHVLKSRGRYPGEY